MKLDENLDERRLKIGMEVNENLEIGK